jgi:hypothetical protein
MSRSNCPSATILSRGAPDQTGRRLPRKLVEERSRRRRTCLIAALLVTLTAGLQRLGRAASEDGEFHANLRYQIEGSLPGCWDQWEFRHRIARRTGYDPFRDSAPVSVLVHVSGSASAVGGRVDWKDANGAGMGERRFVAKDGNCGKLLAEMSFAVALQIELLRSAPKPEPDAGAPATPATDSPNGTGAPATTATPSSTTSPSPSTVTSAPTVPGTRPAPPEPAPATAAKPEAVSRTETSNKDASAEAETPSRDGQPGWAFWLGLGPSLAWGMSPSTLANGRLFLGIRRDDLSFEVGLEASYPSENQRWRGSGFREMVIAGTAGVCGHLSAISACALGKAGQLRIEGLGVDEPQKPSGFLAQTGARLGATLGLGENWLVAGHLGGLLLLTPRTVQLNGASVWDMPRLSAFAGIDLGARFR